MGKRDANRSSRARRRDSANDCQPLMAALLPMLSTLPMVGEGALVWAVGGLIVVLGLFVYGLRDVRRFSLVRSLAIGGVCLKESLRRRVLWVTPLAMLAVIALGQVIRPADPEDAIRQMTGQAFFASALIALLTGVVLACTNLPRDLESKIIFTLVTKPATRLEIVLGKIVGFAGTTAAVLGVMLVFTLCYLSLQAVGFGRTVRAELAGGAADVTRLNTLRHYADVGLLSTRALSTPRDLQLYAAVPEPGATSRLFYGGTQDAVLRFDVTPEQFLPPDAPADGTVRPGDSGLELSFLLSYRFFDGTVPPEPPVVAVSFLDADGFDLVRADALPENGRVRLADPAGRERVSIRLSPARAAELRDAGTFYLRFQGSGGGLVYGISDRPAALRVPPLGPTDDPDAGRLLPPTQPPILRGRGGDFGQQLLGPTDAPGQVALYTFLDVAEPEVIDGEVPLEFRFGVERSSETDVDLVDAVVTATVRNHADGESYGPYDLYPESLRPVYLSVPAAAVAGGAFDVIVANQTPGQIVGVGEASVAVITDRQPFVWNLFKGFGSIWLLCVMAVAAGVCASTFVSWPIAIVLTVLLLTGRWAVDSVRDVLRPGYGQRVAGDLYGGEAGAGVDATRATVEGLRQALVGLAGLLPDLRAFGADRFVENGESVPWRLLGESALVGLGYALPLAVLAYVVLRNKEVAR